MCRQVGPASFLVDVGTDHALLPLAWLSLQPEARALGVDRAQQPLLGAAQNRECSPAGARLELRQHVGLGELSVPEDAVLSVSGMGGVSIQEILHGALAVRQHQLSRIVLGPNDRCDAVRAALRDLGWQISKEDALWDRGRFYPVIQATPAGEKPQILELLDLRFGPHLLRNAHPALATWLHRQALRLGQIRAQLAPKCPPPELKNSLKTITAAWAQYFQDRYGELLNPHGLTAPPST